ncbi:septation regulator SpoVG [Phocea massiliensis]|uniref:Septation regulator SpoVG n=1 Tax=Merdimmobilis hominis TaxID=2897707 RepID=A0A938X785_9FIRM|nr:septation regulator SpoVG [Merdimmobilis hominis]MBM6920466.1 septation regulator SpoVG [Merdimmobilis hominis]
MLNITDVRIRKLLHDGRLRAIVSVTFDNAIALHDLKVIEGPNRLFVAMPSRKDESGTYRDIVHPISKENRAQIEHAVLAQYETAVSC